MLLSAIPAQGNVTGLPLEELARRVRDASRLLYRRNHVDANVSFYWGMVVHAVLEDRTIVLNAGCSFIQGPVSNTPELYEELKPWLQLSPAMKAKITKLHDQIRQHRAEQAALNSNQ